MKSIIICIMFSLMCIGCNNMSVSTPDNYTATVTSTNNTALLTTFGDDKAIYIDQYQHAIIISKSGDVLANINLRNTQPVEMNYHWKTSIPHNTNDTVYAEAEFIDDMIYYKYWVKHGKTYGVKPYLQSSNLLKLVDLPCQSGWIDVIDEPKTHICEGNVKSSLTVWKSVLTEYGFRTTSNRKY